MENNCKPILIHHINDEGKSRSKAHQHFISYQDHIHNQFGDEYEKYVHVYLLSNKTEVEMLYPNINISDEKYIGIINQIKESLHKISSDGIEG